MLPHINSKEGDESWHKVKRKSTRMSLLMTTDNSFYQVRAVAAYPLLPSKGLDLHKLQSPSGHFLDEVPGTGLKAQQKNNIKQAHFNIRVVAFVY